MASNKKSSPRYDLKAQDRKRDLFIRVGPDSPRWRSSPSGWSLHRDGQGEKAAPVTPKAVRRRGLTHEEAQHGASLAVLSIYEDFQCPHCRDFEKAFGPTITKLIDSGAVAVDYYMVALPGLGQGQQGYSTWAANAGYCVGDEKQGVRTLPRRAVRPAARGGFRHRPR